jgi:hypothetical protein
MRNPGVLRQKITPKHYLFNRSAHFHEQYTDQIILTSFYRNVSRFLPFVINRSAKTAYFKGKKPFEFIASCEESTTHQERLTFKTAKLFSRNRHIRWWSINIRKNATKVLWNTFYAMVWVKLSFAAKNSEYHDKIFAPFTGYQFGDRLRRCWILDD